MDEAVSEAVENRAKRVADADKQGTTETTTEDKEEQIKTGGGTLRSENQEGEAAVVDDTKEGTQIVGEGSKERIEREDEEYSGQDQSFFSGMGQGSQETQKIAPGGEVWGDATDPTQSVESSRQLGGQHPQLDPRPSLPFRKPTPERLFSKPRRPSKLSVRQDSSQSDSSIDLETCDPTSTLLLSNADYNKSDLHQRVLMLQRSNDNLTLTLESYESTMTKQNSTIEEQKRTINSLKGEVARRENLAAQIEEEHAETIAQHEATKQRETNAKQQVIVMGHAKVEAVRQAEEMKAQVHTLTEEANEARRVAEEARGQSTDNSGETFDEKIKRQLRYKVLEAENEHLRNDLFAARELVGPYIQAQMEISWELNEDTLKARDEAESERLELLEAAAELPDGADILAELGTRFRGSSIFKEEGKAEDSPSQDKASLKKIASSPFRDAHTGALVASPASMTSPSLLPPVRPLTANRNRTGALLSSSSAKQAVQDSETEVARPPPSASVIASSQKPLIDFRSPGSESTGQTLSGMREDMNNFTTPDIRTWIASSRLRIHLEREKDLPLGITLLYLLAAFFLALYADRLAAERDTWAKANGAVRGLTATWHGREWWAQDFLEWATWKSDMWAQMEHPMIV